MTSIRAGGGILLAIIGATAQGDDMKSTDRSGRVYEQYAWKTEYKDLPMSQAGFAVLPRTVEGRPAVCIKQRDGNGGSPYQFDLPGGTLEAADRDLRAAVSREVSEELGVRCEVLAAIGEPLYLPIKKDGSIVRIDRSQAFLVRAAGTPSPHQEALSVAFVHMQSLAGFKVVGGTSDQQGGTFGRTAIMVFDGLSVLQRPVFEGEITGEIRSRLDGDAHSTDFLLLDGGRYFGRTTSVREDGRQKTRIALYYRLNPDQPGGRFAGSLDHLAH